MSLRIGKHKFDYVSYDANADILYLGKGGRPPVISDFSPEGHSINYSISTREFVGLDVMAPRLRLDRDGQVTITLPGENQVAIEGIEAALKQPA